MTARKFTVSAVAKRLGIPKSTFYELIQTGKGPRPLRIGKRIYLLPAPLDEWLRECGHEIRFTEDAA